MLATPILIALGDTSKYYISMNEEDLYSDFPELLTAEEREDNNHVRGRKDCCPGFERWWKARIDSPVPDAHDRHEFESQRRPGMGMTLGLIEEILLHDAKPGLTPVQRRLTFRVLRSHMLRNLTPCSGCSTLPELLAVLRGEIESNTASAIPTW